MLDCTQVRLTFFKTHIQAYIYYGLHVSQASGSVFDKCLTVNEWINLVNSSNVITKAQVTHSRARLRTARVDHG